MPADERLDPACAIDAAIGGTMIENSGFGVGEAKRNAIAGAIGARRNPRRICDVPQRLLQHGPEQGAPPSPALRKRVERSQQLAIDTRRQHRCLLGGGCKLRRR
ncbi:hypothetical protein [Sphingomonas sp. NBWT7]|uniref:hypothetical protein n=1 Tax=Sphingomonas sp. NBWT7 TaxID=2596913 RepID=UPI0021566052|nr:hypothetical protein [Sphingomonas sp. NBWT7]